jgi:inhibitor of cysteine peptidase
MLVIDQMQNNGVAEVLVGDPFKVQLSENPTTGYRWRMQSAVSPGLRIVEDYFEPSSPGYGSGGVRSWTLVADKPAVVALRIERRRSWRPDPVETFNVTVVAKAR